ncbi:hypothetical protein Acid345_1487 [Candidatus Koribacter versatilis Ellin345]|uniref:Lipoprotein n=1 Tax=Koribacter versatilis (strain Ellin345) TaxID=204669 RepID=Q1IRL1_KORVE|nr:hypothetical protein [Candidatus Koribacter versatilis]ABF40489.1 hypothetical protein Acid345_1487 [Candidatus Koribacter versatilis Ellin345]
MRLWTSFILSILLLCAACALAQAPAKPAAKDCDDLRIKYAPIEQKYADRLVVEPNSDQRPNGETRTSPQHTRWVLAVAPDYSKAGPWTTNIWVGEGDTQTTVRLILKEHEGFSIQWLNEKLLYGSVSWSKSLNTVFIFDAETKKFLYREMEDASEMGEACE